MVRLLSFVAGFTGESAIKRILPTRGFLIFSVILISALALTGCQLDKTFGFQGYLTDALGNPITGTRNLEFKFWNCSSGGPDLFCNVQYQEAHNNVPVDSGLFNVVIGSQTPPDPGVFAGPMWVEIVVDGEALSPRQKVLGAPYAMSLVGGAAVLSLHEGDGDTGGGDTDVTDENYGTLSVVASGAKGTSLMLGVLNNGGDLIRGCSGNFTAARTCPDLKFRVTSAGEVYADGTFHASGADFAEMIQPETTTESFEPGDVLVISKKEDRAVGLSTEPYSSAVIGVYSTKPGVLGMPYAVEEFSKNADLPVAIVGIVPVKVSAENGPVYRGDLLTTANTPGYAMKATRLTPGTLLGKAMGQLLSGKGVVQVLLMLH